MINIHVYYNGKTQDHQATVNVDYEANVGNFLYYAVAPLCKDFTDSLGYEEEGLLVIGEGVTLEDCIADTARLIQAAYDNREAVIEEVEEGA